MVVKLDSFSGDNHPSFDYFDIDHDAKSYKIERGVTSISEHSLLLSAFNLRKLYIPDSVISIHNEAFINSYYLRTIKVDRNNPCYSTKAGVLYDKTFTKLLAYPIGKNVGSFQIPDGVISISSYAFYGVNKLTCIEIPTSLKVIEKHNLLESPIRTLKFFHSNPSYIEFKDDKTKIIDYIRICKILVPYQYIEAYKEHPILKESKLLVPYNKSVYIVNH